MRIITCLLLVVVACRVSPTTVRLEATAPSKPEQQPEPRLPGVPRLPTEATVTVIKVEAEADGVDTVTAIVDVAGVADVKEVTALLAGDVTQALTPDAAGKAAFALGSTRVGSLVAVFSLRTAGGVFSLGMQRFTFVEPKADAAMSTITVTRLSGVAADGVDAAEVTVQLRTKSGAPVSHASLAASAGDAMVDVSLLDVSGRSVVLVRALTAGARTLAVTADDVTLLDAPVIAFVAPEIELARSSVTLSKERAVADDADVIGVDVALATKTGGVANEAGVELRVSGTNHRIAGGPRHFSVTSRTAEAKNVAILVDGKPLSLRAIRFVAGAPDAARSSLSVARAKTSPALGERVTVRMRDHFDNPCSDVMIAPKTTATVSAAPLATDAAGEATFELHAALAGDYDVQVGELRASFSVVPPFTEVHGGELETVLGARMPIFDPRDANHWYVTGVHALHETLDRGRSFMRVRNTPWPSESTVSCAAMSAGGELWTLARVGAETVVYRRDVGGWRKLASTPAPSGECAAVGADLVARVVVPGTAEDALYLFSVNTGAVTIDAKSTLPSDARTLSSVRVQSFRPDPLSAGSFFYVVTAHYTTGYSTRVLSRYDATSGAHTAVEPYFLYSEYEPDPFAAGAYYTPFLRKSPSGATGLATTLNMGWGVGPQAIAVDVLRPGTTYGVGLNEVLERGPSGLSVLSKLPPMDAYLALLRAHPAASRVLLVNGMRYVVDDAGLHAAVVPWMRASDARTDDVGALVLRIENNDLARFHQGRWSYVPLIDGGAGAVSSFQFSDDGATLFTIREGLNEIDAGSARTRKIAIAGAYHLFDRYLAAEDGVYERRDGAWTKLAAADLSSHPTAVAVADGQVYTIEDADHVRQGGQSAALPGLGANGRFFDVGGLFAYGDGCALFRNEAGAWHHVTDLCGIVALGAARGELVAYTSSNGDTPVRVAIGGEAEPCAENISGSYVLSVDPNDADHVYVTVDGSVRESFTGCR